MMIGLVLALSLLAVPQRPQQGPPPPDISAIAGHAARLTVLEQRRQELEAELIAARRQFGESHPQVLTLRDQLALAERALAGEGSTWREGEIDELAAHRTNLEQQLATARTKYGPNHPLVVSLRSEIAATSARLSGRSSALLASGLEQVLLAETRKGSTDLQAFLRLAKLYAAADRTADAQRVLADAIALLRERGR